MNGSGPEFHVNSGSGRVGSLHLWVGLGRVKKIGSMSNAEPETQHFPTQPVRYLCLLRYLLVLPLENRGELRLHYLYETLRVDGKWLWDHSSKFAGYSESFHFLKLVFRWDFRLVLNSDWDQRWAKKWTRFSFGLSESLSDSLKLNFGLSDRWIKAN